MKKSTIIVKRALALFLVVLMSIENFAAVVGDNDGAAFITKAEFDSLKNNFQSQIDQYNTSIDAKIDGAIASYLAGIKTNAIRSPGFIYSQWDEFSMNNDFIVDECAMPNIRFCTTSQVAGLASTDNTHGQHWTGYVEFSYMQNHLQKRKIVEAGNESTLGVCPRTVLWVGLYEDVIEQIEMAESYYGFAQPWSTGTPKSALANNAGTSYINKLWSGFEYGYKSSDIMRSGIEFANKDGAGYYGVMRIDRAWHLNTNNLSLDTEKKKFEHIGDFNSQKLYWISDPDWLHTVNKNTQDDNVPFGKASMSIDFARTKWIDNGGIQHWSVTSNFVLYTGAYGTNDNTTIRGHVGLLPNGYTAENIKWSNSPTQAMSKDTTYIADTDEAISYGFPICAVDDGEKFNWDFEIESCQYCKKDSAGSRTESSYNGRYKVYFCFGGFKNGVDVVDGGAKIYDPSNPTNSYFETNDQGKIKINFKCEKSGILYAKWEPIDLPTDYEGWIATIDCKNGNKPKIEESDS